MMVALYHAFGTSRILEGLTVCGGLVESQMGIGRPSPANAARDAAGSAVS
jgi:hypothetical protein